MKKLATNHPVSFVLVLTVAWLALLLTFTGIASSMFREPFGGATSGTVGRLAVTACVLLLLRRLGWLGASGVARLGRWHAWALASVGMIYFASTSLYSLYGKAAFDFSILMRLPDSHTAVMTQSVVGLCEEILFRGLVLYVLIRVWGKTTQGIVGSVALTSLLFAVLHIMQVPAHDVSLPSVLLLTLQTGVISIWWGALVVSGGSIWPVVMLHFVVNAVLAIQGLTVPMVEPAILAYRRILWFSVPLGVLGIGMLMREGPRQIVPEVP